MTNEVSGMSAVAVCVVKAHDGCVLLVVRLAKWDLDVGHMVLVICSSARSTLSWPSPCSYNNSVASRAKYPTLFWPVADAGSRPCQ